MQHIMQLLWLYTLKEKYYNKIYYTWFAVVETKKFTSWTAFISWKEEEELNTHTCFVKPKGESEGSNEHTGRNMYYSSHKP